jgi:FkbM family methyltransferase
MTPMILHQGIYFPDGEINMTEWMTLRGEVVDGRGTYQIKKLRKAVSYCKRFRTAVDGGCHVGTWTRQLAKRFAHVHAFEPVSAHRECFALNVEARNVVLHPCALGEHEGRVSISSEPHSSGESWVSGPGDIPMYTLDSFDLIDVDLIKLDVEGTELPILRGAARLLERCRPVVCVEQKKGHAERFGLPDTGAVDYLQSLHYELAEEIFGDYILVPA